MTVPAYVDALMIVLGGKLDGINTAYAIAIAYGAVPGEHHKQWVIDQMLRALLGTSYDDIIAEYNRIADAPWDTGVVP